MLSLLPLTRLLCVVFAAWAVLCMAAPLTAVAQSAGVNPGAVLNGVMREQWMNRNAAWAGRYYLEDPNEVKKRNEPVIEFHNLDLKGSIMPSKAGAEATSTPKDTPAVP